MNQKYAVRSLICVMLLSLTATLFSAAPAMKFDPAGTWKYSAPGVTEGYTEGEFVITELEGSYGVTMVLFGTYKVEAGSVEYSKKSLKFTVSIDGTVVDVSGTFKKDVFTGTVSYYEGVFDFTAERKIEMIEK